MKKIIILTILLLLTNVSGYTSSSMNELVETKVEHAEIIAPVHLMTPVGKPAGKLLKLVIEAFQQSGKKLISIDDFVKLTKISIKNTDSLKKLTYNQAVGYIFWEEIQVISKISSNFNPELKGQRINFVLEKLGKDIVSNVEDLKNLHFVTKSNIEHRKATEILKKNKSLTLEELAREVKIILNKQSGPKLNLGSAYKLKTVTKHLITGGKIVSEIDPKTKKPMKEFLYNYGGNEKYYLKDEISYVYKEDGSVIKEIKQRALDVNEPYISIEEYNSNDKLVKKINYDYAYYDTAKNHNIIEYNPDTGKPTIHRFYEGHAGRKSVVKKTTYTYFKNGDEVVKTYEYKNLVEEVLTRKDGTKLKKEYSQYSRNTTLKYSYRKNGSLESGKKYIGKELIQEELRPVKGKGFTHRIYENNILIEETIQKGSGPKITNFYEGDKITKEITEHKSGRKIIKKPATAESLAFESKFKNDEFIEGTTFETDGSKTVEKYKNNELTEKAIYDSQGNELKKLSYTYNSNGVWTSKEYENEILVKKTIHKLDGGITVIKHDPESPAQRVLQYDKYGKLLKASDKYGSKDINGNYEFLDSKTFDPLTGDIIIRSTQDFN